MLEQLKNLACDQGWCWRSCAGNALEVPPFLRTSSSQGRERANRQRNVRAPAHLSSFFLVFPRCPSSFLSRRSILQASISRLLSSSLRRHPCRPPSPFFLLPLLLLLSPSSSPLAFSNQLVPAIHIHCHLSSLPVERSRVYPTRAHRYILGALCACWSSVLLHKQT